jgi:hypothetical protein
MDKNIAGLEAENMYLRINNKKLKNKLKKIEEIEETNTNQHPLEESIIFDCENEYKKKNKKTHYQKIAHKYKKTINILNTLSTTYNACKFLLLLII